MTPGPTDAERALFLAIGAGDGAQVRALVAAEPGLLRAVSPMGVSPVLHATYYGQHEVARVLVEAGAPLSLFEAAATGELGVVRQALDAYPDDIHTMSPDGFSALGLAAFFGREDVAAELLSRGADVNAESRNAMRVRPLHSAVAGNHAGLARRLLDAGADVNAAQQDSFTPLMGAAQNGNAELVAELLLHGADPGAQATDGRTAADLAREEGHEAALRALRVG